MPVAPPRVCGCGKVVAGGTRCACQIKRHAEAKARFDQRRPTARQRGYDSKWEQARAEFLAAHRHCVRCGQPATIVDHITPHRGDLKLFWRRSNWQPMCTHCHSSRKQREERRI
jgi:5-methylcytosine-specific restriction endonuclease McrA